MAALLDLREVAALAECEAVIDRGLRQFYEVGAALVTIRDARLYRATHATFEDYCHERWGLGRRTAYQLIDAAGVVESVRHGAQILPANERQARPLIKVPAEERPEVWAEAVETAPAGRVTAAHVAAVVEQFRQPDRLAPLYSSASPEWYTPAHVVAAVLDFFDEIDLDPCSNSHQDPVIPARQHFTQEDDGLSRPWWGRVYINPPYGSEVIDWTTRAVTAYLSREIEAAILLVAARTDTDWFTPLLNFPICFIHGRLKFDGPNGTGNSAGFPSALVYLGDDYHGFAGAVAHLGPVVRRYDGGAR